MKSENNDKHQKENSKNLDLYSINENLLQSYRQIFISTETFLLGVAVFAFDNKPMVFFPIVGLGIIIIGLGWLDCLRLFEFTGKCGVIIARARIVDYYKYNVNKTNISLDDYVHKREKRQKANKIIGGVLYIKGNWRETRKIVDRWIPVFFTVVWIILFLFFELNPDLPPNNSVTILEKIIELLDSVIN